MIERHVLLFDMLLTFPGDVKTVHALQAWVRGHGRAIQLGVGLLQKKNAQGLPTKGVVDVIERGRLHGVHHAIRLGRAKRRRAYTTNNAATTKGRTTEMATTK